jgi:hypothetical protein
MPRIRPVEQDITDLATGRSPGRGGDYLVEPGVHAGKGADRHPLASGARESG